ncbi:hypothetical protein ACX0G7_25905, partial [Flavitalea antarctica]
YMVSSSTLARISPGTAAGFFLYTSGGAVVNTGSSQFTGDIGSVNGPINGFMPSSTVTGNIVLGGTVAGLGNGETIATGVHFMVTAFPALTNGFLSIARSCDKVNTY